MIKSLTIFNFLAPKMLFKLLITPLLTLTFITTINSLILHCNFKDSSSYGYICEVSHLEITSKTDRTITGVTGQHRPARSNDDVKFLQSSGKTVNFFPKELEKFFKNLETIWLNGAKLKEISSEDLKVFTKLKRFSIGYNEVEVIEADLFKFNGNLEWIDLESNKIKHVENGAITGLKTLKEFYFNGNPCHSGGAGNIKFVAPLASLVEGKCKDVFYVVKNLQDETQKRLNKLEAEILQLKLDCKCGVTQLKKINELL